MAYRGLDRASGGRCRSPFGFLRWAVASALSSTVVCLAWAQSSVSVSDEPGYAVRGAYLQVTRASGALDCPDSAGLGAQISAALAAASLPPGSRQQVSVHFARSEGRYRAELALAGERNGRRSLVADDSSCQGIAGAAVVAVALSLDPEWAAPEQLAPRRAVAASADEPRGPTAGGVAANDTPLATAGDLGLYLELGPALTRGFTTAFTPGAELGLEVQSGRWRLGAVAFSTLSAARELGEGTTHVWLWGGHLRPCAALWGSPTSWALDGCLQFTAASLRGRATDYAQVESARARPWLALGPALALRTALSASFGSAVTLATLFPFTRENYAIGNLGLSYETPAVAFWLGFSLSAQIL
jgi:hypothetical protein